MEGNAKFVYGLDGLNREILDSSMGIPSGSVLSGMVSMPSRVGSWLACRGGQEEEHPAVSDLEATRPLPAEDRGRVVYLKCICTDR